MNRYVYLLFLCLYVPEYIFSQSRSLIPGAGVCDSHVHIFNGKAYLYSGRDSLPNSHAIMPEWNIYSSDNLIDWKLERIIKPEETFLGKGAVKCWACDAAYMNGKYYFYYSNGKDHSVGVLIGDTPTGPFKDPLNGQKLLYKGLTPNRCHHDPCIFIEDDGIPYIIFGRSEKTPWYCSRLNKNMISLADSPRPIGKSELNSDQPTLFKHNGKYYLSFTEGRYMMADSLWGDYGAIKEAGRVGGHGSYFNWHNQWYRTANHRDTGSKHYRKSIMTYVHFKDNGELVHDMELLNNGYAAGFGVGQYDAEWPKIEAEWYFKLEGVLVKRECPLGGFEIQNIHSGDYLYFPNIKNMKKNIVLSFNVSAKQSSIIEIRENSLNGELLGICNIDSTGGWGKYKDYECLLKNTEESNSLFFVFKGDNSELLHLNYFRFK